MIEKVDITAGSGTPIGADLVSGSYFQYLKLLDGTSGSASPIAGDSTYGLDVDVTRLPENETTGANVKSTLRAWDISTETYVDIQTTGDGLLRTSIENTNAYFNVVNDGTFSSQITDIVSGTSDANLGKLEKDTHSGSGVGIMMLGISNNDQAYFASADLKYTPISVDRQGRVFINAGDGLVSSLVGYYTGEPIDGTTANGLDVDVTRLPALSTGSNVIGSVSISGSVSNGLIQGITNTEIRATPLVVSGSITAIAAGDNNIGNVDVVTMPTVTVNPHNVVIASGSIMSGAFASGAISASAMADGAIVTVGAKTDARSTATDATSTSMMAVLKEVSYMEQNPASRAVTNAGTFSVQASSLIPGTSASSLGKAEDAVHASGDTGVMGLAVRKDTAAALAGSDGDYAPLEVDASGRLHIAPLVAGTQKIGTIVLDSGSSLAGRISSSQETSTVYNATTALTPKFFAISASMANSNTLVAGVAGKKIRVTSMAIMSASTVNVKFQSGAAGTDLTGYFPLVANTGFVLPDNPTGWFETTASALLNMFTSASVSLGGCGKYLEV